MKFLKSPRAALVVLLGAGVSMFGAAPAHAALFGILPAGGGCAATVTTEPFTAWGDTNDYTLVAGSLFTTNRPSGWTLGGGAAVVPLGEAYGVTAPIQPGALSLPAGASAQSPSTCVDYADPTWRFFLDGMTSSATLQVSVVYTTPVLGFAQSTTVGTISPTAGWQPSPTLYTGAALQSVLHGGSANVALRFTELSGTTDLDAAFIDPRMRG